MSDRNRAQKQDDRPGTHHCMPDEAVPAALRGYLHWDFRHDAVARLIMGEAGLTLLRDRELIRQLAFIRVQQGAVHIIPFGKHKRRLLEEIVVDDPSYLDWLAERWRACSAAKSPAATRCFVLGPAIPVATARCK